MRTMRLRLMLPAISGLLVGVILLGGCHALRVSQGIRQDAADWPMDGRTAGHASLAAGWVIPPLVSAWEADLGSGVGGGSPLAADSFIIVGTLRGEVLLFQASTGERLGVMAFGDAVPGSPVLGGSTVYIPLANTPESMVAYDLTGGRILWKSVCGPITTSPLLVEHRLYAGTAEGSLVCLDAESGRILWRYELPVNRTMKGIRSTPASDGSLIVFGADDGFVYALDALLGTLRWRRDTGAPVMAPVALSDGRAFVANLAGTFICVNLADGAGRWRHAGTDPVFAGAALADGMAVFGTTGGKVYALSQADGSAVWEHPVNGVVSAAGVISGSWFFVGTLARSIIALRLTDGGEVWKDSLEGRVKTPPAVARERLIIATDNRVLRSYRSEAP
jgi:outer membrane protein assembly factor BamB